VQANPSLVRDGTTAPATGQAGYTGVIQKVLSYTFGANQSAGVSWPASNTSGAGAVHTSGLGMSGTLNAPFAAPSTLGDFASTVLASQAQDSALVSAQVNTEQAVQTTLSNKLSTESGVNMDTEMSHMIQLQNAYGANARVLTAVQAMFTQLLQAVQ
jgi:flagellar hook-associated protein 1 FlgK